MNQSFFLYINLLVVDLVDPTAGDLMAGGDLLQHLRLLAGLGGILAAGGERQPGLGLMGEVSSPCRISPFMGWLMPTEGMAESGALVYEFDQFGNWHMMEDFFHCISGFRDYIWFATNGEIVNYISRNCPAQDDSSFPVRCLPGRRKHRLNGAPSNPPHGCRRLCGRCTGFPVHQERQRND